MGGDGGFEFAFGHRPPNLRVGVAQPFEGDAQNLGCASVVVGHDQLGHRCGPRIRRTPPLTDWLQVCTRSHMNWIESLYSSPRMANTLNSVGHRMLFTATPSSGNQMVTESSVSEGAGVTTVSRPAMLSVTSWSNVSVGDNTCRVFGA